MFFRVVLDRRLGMYNQALRVAPLETAAELYRSVMESHHRWEFCVNHNWDLFFSISLLRNYFLSFGFFFLCIIFGFGLCFGRVTRRYLFLVYYLGADEKLESMSRTSEGADYGVFVWIHVSFTVQTCFCPGSMERWKIDESLKRSSSPPSLRKVWRLSWNRPTRPFCKWNWPSGEKWPFLTDSVPICPQCWSQCPVIWKVFCDTYP